jgi:hypothetical protein
MYLLRRAASSLSFVKTRFFTMTKFCLHISHIADQRKIQEWNGNQADVHHFQFSRRGETDQRCRGQISLGHCAQQYSSVTPPPAHIHIMHRPFISIDHVFSIDERAPLPTCSSGCLGTFARPHRRVVVFVTMPELHPRVVLLPLVS